MSNNKQFVNPDSANNRPDGLYKKVLSEIKTNGVCPFCRENLKAYHKNPILYHGKSWLITKNMYPYAGSKIHLLAIHREHVEHISDITPDAWTELHQVLAGRTSLKVMTGGTFLMRFGEMRFNGASVSHIHAQLIAGSGKPCVDPVMARVG